MLAVNDAQWPRDDLDRFVFAAQQAASVEADGDARTLLRRLHFDLIGLPSTPEQVQAFEKAAASDRQMPYDSPQQRNEQLTATGFLTLTSKPRPQGNPNYQMDLVAEQTPRFFTYWVSTTTS